MSFALIEVQATARKAARGVGYSWGMAEEAGHAARWLCGAGFDGCAALALALQTADQAKPRMQAPVGLTGEWQAKNGNLCPLLAGAALSDAASLWAAHGVSLQNVTAPALLLPFAANAARALGTTVTISWDGVKAVTDGNDVSLDAPHKISAQVCALRVRLTTGGALDQALPRHSRAYPTDTDWVTLNGFAERIYAPDTEESRLKGAGAGLSDND